MSQLVSLLAILGALVAGLLLGIVPHARAFSGSRLFGAIRTATLASLIAAMGFRMGRTDEVIDSIGSLGLAALVMAAATLAGTVIVLAAVALLRRRATAGAAEGPREGGARVWWGRLLRDPALLLVVLAAGFLAGRFIPVAPGANGSGLITWILYALLLMIGFGLGGSGIRFGEIVTHPDLFLIPLGTLAGSLLGGLLAGLLLRMRAGTALSLAAGLGWYSLSGVILTRVDGPALGALAFLSNMLRESMALVLIPFLGRTRFPSLAIGAGGATSMDVALPLIEKSCGPRSVAFAVASGGLLSLSVPVLVPLLYHLGR